MDRYGTRLDQYGTGLDRYGTRKKKNYSDEKKNSRIILGALFTIPVSLDRIQMCTYEYSGRLTHDAMTGCGET